MPNKMIAIENYCANDVLATEAVCAELYGQETTNFDVR